MARYVERGLESHHEQDQRMLIRDTRTFGQRVDEFFSNPLHASILLFGIGRP